MKTIRFLDRTIGWILPGLVGLVASKIFVKPRQVKSRNMSSWTLLHSAGDYVAWGKSVPGAKRTVLIIHGWESHAGHMNILAEALNSAGFNVVAMDAPAHGDAKGKATNAIQFAAALLKISDELGPFDTVIGHSMGGGALFIALSDGLSINKVVTIGSPFLFSDVLERFAKYMDLPPRARKSFIDRVEAFTGRSWDETRGDVVAPKVKQPTLIVHDEQDKEIPFSDALALEKAIPNATILKTSGLGHRRILRDRTTASAIAEWIK